MQQPPSADIFTENHLSHIVQSEVDLRNYFIHALCIDKRFVERFDMHALMSALEHTLYHRPPLKPTEIYLKSQRLWIMDKLLVRLGLKGQMQLVLQSRRAPPTPKLHTARRALVNLCSYLWHGTMEDSRPLYATFQELERAIDGFKTQYRETLNRESVEYTRHRCSVIRWFAHIAVENGEAAVMEMSPEQITQMYDEWKH